MSKNRHASKKRGRPPGSKNGPNTARSKAAEKSKAGALSTRQAANSIREHKRASRASTVSDAMAKSPARPVKPKPLVMKERDCEFCGHTFDAACGRHGCPNCNGEGLEPPVEQGRVGTCIALMAVNPYAARPGIRTFPIIPTFGDFGARHDLAVVLEDSAWRGFKLMTDDGDIWMEAYEA